ncbi:MAG: carbohydrate binding family 9 domain-containing protein, partial [Gemmatimonadetes bacterium]|nr:carbohydrate binding family 9 domain-containing protein [Gemmatimonadota bacterium]
MAKRWRLIPLALLAIGLPDGLRAQAGGVDPLPAPVEDPLSLPRPTLQALRTDEPIVLDGRLDEEAWHRADSTDGVFWTTIPRQGHPSRERTVVRVLYDAEKIYIGAMLFDPSPDQLFSAGLEQDFRTENSDMFAFALDTYLDRQNAFMFSVNPAGALFDAQAFNDQAYVNREWEGIVEVSTSVQEWGWIAEVAIPITTLRFDATRPDQTWGVNFSRRIRRFSEDSFWAPLSRQYRLYKMSLAGTLTGLQDLRQGRNLWIKPWSSVGRAEGITHTSADTRVEGGLDLKWGLTPQLTLDATALTDFSQVEVDEQQVNLTRFPLFFPEKRDFFLENDGIFGFQDAQVRNYRLGSGPSDFKLFHSRRIGLSPEREPLPIGGGARLTGRMGAFDVGLLNMQTRDDPLAEPENFTVVRLRRNLLTSSDVGVMFTNRQTTGGDDAYNRAAGVDGNFRFGSTLVNAYFAASDQPDAEGSTMAGKLELAWRSPLWDVSAFGKTVGDGFNPGLGFVSRRAFRQAFVTVGAHPQPDLRGVAEINPYVDASIYTNLDGELETRELTGGVQVSFMNSSTLTFEGLRQHEMLSA